MQIFVNGYSIQYKYFQCLFMHRGAKCMHKDSSTKTTALTPALNTTNSCSLVEMHGAETLLFLMCAANMNTHRCRATASDTYTPLGSLSLMQQTSHSYLVCLPACLPTVFSLLLLCIGLCLTGTADCSKWQLQLGGRWVRMKRVKWQLIKVVRWDKQ